MSVPDTRPSLLLRIRDAADREAWEEFEGLYRQVIHRMAIARGMQVADADDLTQQVLWSISQAIDRFEPDDTRARFRTLAANDRSTSDRKCDDAKPAGSRQGRHRRDDRIVRATRSRARYQAA